MLIDECEICLWKNVEGVKIEPHDYKFCWKCWEKYFRPYFSVVYELLKGNR